MELSASFTRALLSGFDRAYADLLRVATRSTGSREEAGDLVHDTWLRLAEHVHRAPASLLAAGASAEKSLPHDVTAYLATMAQHLALDTHRRSQRHGRYLDAELAREQLAPSHVPDVAETVMYRQALAVLETSLESLPERVRHVFVAHRVYGEKQPEIAQRMGVSLNTVERDVMLAGDCIEAALQRWRGEALSTPPASRHKGRRRSLGALLSVAGVGLGASLGWRQWQDWRQHHVQWQAAWQSHRGQQLRQTLPDGSLVTLDAMSAAAVQFFAARRAVQLQQGAAFFEVAHDNDRPFSVETEGVRIVVLGTRFGVEITPDAGNGSRVQIQVESGRVRVEPGPGLAPYELGAGDALQVQRGVARRLPLQGTVAAWRQGELVFVNATLGEALQRLERYATFSVKASPGAAALNLTGHVRIAQAQTWIQALPRALPVQLQRNADGWQVVLRSTHARG